MLIERSVPATAMAASSERPGGSLRILVAHNRYQQAGGEDEVFSAEVELLRAHGHEVIEYAVCNDEVEQINRLSLARYASWNPNSYRKLVQLCESKRPDIVHVHNTLPLISPAVYYAAARSGAGVIQTLHNFRLFCPAAFLFRDGHVCEECLGRRFAWPGIVHACYRGSRAATAASAASSGLHRLAGTYRNKVDRYLALTAFGAAKAQEGGLPAKKIRIKPNFLSRDPGAGSGAGGYALFVGRLSAEKGIETLLEASASAPDIPLKIVGSGPEEEKVRRTAAQCGHIEWLGRRPHGEVIELMKEATFLIFPSEWYEGFPMTIVEAFACGLPVLASNLGSMSSIVRHQVTGLHFRPGSPENLCREMRWAFDRPVEMARMRTHARREFADKYTAEKNYELLLDVYHEVLEERVGIKNKAPSWSEPEG